MQGKHDPGPVRRLVKFVGLLGLSFFFVYCLLPSLTSTVPILAKMSSYLDDNGIDPTRYYYTDVEQVEEAELYLRSALDKDGGQYLTPHR